MSNDTDFKLKFSCPNRDQLEHVLWYLNFKKERWDHWERAGNIPAALASRVGTKSTAAVVSWGFSVTGKIKVTKNGQASIGATAWANQNSSNVWISGDCGELADLRERFPFLTIEGTYKDEDGHRGDV